MSKFNSKAESAKPTEINEMGESAYKLSDKENLVATCLTTFLGDSYYEKESETIEKIKNCVENVDPLFVSKLSLYVRNQGKLRSSSHLLASLNANRISGTDYASRFFRKIVSRPDDMSEILSCYAALNGMSLKDIKKIPNAMKKGFKKALENLDAYQIDKYKMNGRDIKLIDLVNLFHPKSNKKNAEAYKRLMNGESLSGLYDSKILEKEMSKAGQTATSVEEKSEAKKEAVSEVLDNVKGMPIFNLLRNLRNIIMYAPDKVDDAVKQLTTHDKIVNSKLLPFRFATAYSEIEKMEYNGNKVTTDIAFESDRSKYGISVDEFGTVKSKVLNAIERALEISCENIPTLEGNTAILIDDSGSMRGDGGGTGRVSAFSSTTNAMIGHLFASMFAWKQKDVYIGLFGNKLIPIDIDRTKRMLDWNKWAYNEGSKCGGSTEAGIYEFMKKCIEEKKKVDNLIVFSDCQIGNGASTAWYGYAFNEDSNGFKNLFKQFKQINPLCNFVVCNVRSYKGNTVFNPNDRILNIAGWSERIFDVIESNCKGYKALIKEIEKIEI